MADTIVPTTLPSPGQYSNPYMYTGLQAAQPAIAQPAQGGGLLDSLFSIGGLGTALLGSGATGLLGGIGQALAAAAERRQKEKLIQWQLAQAKANLTPQALSKQGMYVNPYSQQVTDAYMNSVMGNLASKLGPDTLAKWGINPTPVSSASEYGSTQQQMSQYSPTGTALLAKYGFAPSSGGNG
jgi:hypothetical protein